MHGTAQEMYFSDHKNVSDHHEDNAQHETMHVQDDQDLGQSNTYEVGGHSHKDDITPRAGKKGVDNVLQHQSDRNAADDGDVGGGGGSDDVAASVLDIGNDSRDNGAGFAHVESIHDRSDILGMHQHEDNILLEAVLKESIKGTETCLVNLLVVETVPPGSRLGERKRETLRMCACMHLSFLTLACLHTATPLCSGFSAQRRPSAT